MRTRVVIGTAFAVLALIALLLQYDSVLVLHSNTRTRRSSSPFRKHHDQMQQLNSDASSHRHGGDHVVQVGDASLLWTTTAAPASARHDGGDDAPRLPQYHDVANNESLDVYLRRRSLRNRILLIPVNTGYIEFGLNLLCSLQRASSTLIIDPTQARVVGGTPPPPLQGFTFVAMDDGALASLQRMRLPVFRDPDMPFVSAKSATWADPKFHKLVCTKLFPVLRALRLNLTVVLSDADIVFRRDPAAYLQRPGLDMIFSIGSCHRDLPDNYDLQAGDGLAKLNTGFYSAVPTPALVALFGRALDRCLHSQAMEGDQPAMNAVLNDNNNQAAAAGARHVKPASSTAVSYGFFDGCLFANGCIYFKHLCANASSLDPLSAAAMSLLRAGKKMPHRKLNGATGTGSSAGVVRVALPPGEVRRDDAVLVHANFLVGKQDKVRHLRKAELWFDSCIARYNDTSLQVM